MINFLKSLIYENNQPSLTRIISIVSIIQFMYGSFYLLLSGQTWAHYESFASFTAGGGLATQVANKFVNSKYNSNTGEPFQK